MLRRVLLVCRALALSRVAYEPRWSGAAVCSSPCDVARPSPTQRFSRAGIKDRTVAHGEHAPVRSPRARARRALARSPPSCRIYAAGVISGNSGAGSSPRCTFSR